MSNSSIDIALTKFDNFLQSYSHFKELDMNESDTRSKVIDHIFKDILNWSEYDIEREESIESGYYDYRISTARFAFIVEAKRDFISFELPDKGRLVSFKTLLKGNKDVINQIRGYIIDKSLAFGVITNGHQFIIGQFLNTSGDDWKDNKAIIYRSLEDINDNFIEFYNTLSKESVLHHNQIRINKPLTSSQTLINYLKGSSQTFVRNEFSAELSTIILKAFGELKHPSKEHEKELLQFCYVKTEDVKKYNSELDNALYDNPPNIDPKIVPARNTSSIQEQIKEKMLSKDMQKPPIMIIIGSKGVGKTTFIKNFFEIELSDKVKTNRPSIYLDFMGYTEQDVGDSKAICKRLIELLKENYPELKLSSIGTLKQIYSKDIKEKKSSIWSFLSNDPSKLDEKISIFLESCLENYSDHLVKISSYLRDHCNKNLCIIFDNADQLSDKAQKEAFIFAESIHQKLHCITIISLREGYYNRWKNKPPFDAFHSTVFHISAPPYREVLKKRLEYVNSHIKFKDIKGEYRGKKITLSVDGFKNLFSSLQYTLLDNPKSEIMTFLEETSFPNIRLGVEKISKFLVSGHTNIAAYILSDRYNIPPWEFIKSIALDSSRYYHQPESLIYNLFSPAPGNSNHFTKIRILEFLYTECDKIIHSEKFTPVKEIIDVFNKAGYSNEIILNELTQLLNSILIDNQIISSDIDSEGTISELSQVKITYAGAYYLNNLACQFSYLELMLQDTPIYNETHFQEIRESFPIQGPHGKSDLSKRYETVLHFLNYLGEQEALDHNRKLQENLHPCLKLRVMNEIVFNHKLQDQLNRIEGRFNQKTFL